MKLVLPIVISIYAIHRWHLSRDVRYINLQRSIMEHMLTSIDESAAPARVLILSAKDDKGLAELPADQRDKQRIKGTTICCISDLINGP